jgi:hypothetical protein
MSLTTLSSHGVPSGTGASSMQSKVNESQWVLVTQGLYQ